jgi:hypothetical protein
MDRLASQESQHPAPVVSPIGLVLPETWAFEQWKALGPVLCMVDGSVQWWLGDWIRFGKAKWSGKYTQALEASGFDYQRLRSAKYVADRFDFSRRRVNLTWCEHRVVAPLPSAQADRRLDGAAPIGSTACVGRPAR